MSDLIPCPGPIPISLVRQCIAAAAISTACMLAPAAHGEDTVSLMTPADAWSFDNGREFPGAKGSLNVEADGGRNQSKTFKLIGDFTGGGGYVQAGRRLEGIDVRELSLWIKSPETNRLTLRLGDASGQTHQIVLKVDTAADWQRVTLPLERFFERRGQADAVTSVANYQSWGGAKDGRWHGPAKGIYLLLSNLGTNEVRTVWLSDIAVVVRPAAVAGAEQRASIRLDEIVQGVHDWRFARGAEFPGAKGALTTVADLPQAGEACLKLAGDFTGGGAYVAAIRDLDGLDMKDVLAFRMRAKSTNAASIGVQIVDATGQTHQRKNLPIKTDGNWHEVEILPEKIAGGEHWAGANDGKWHGPARKLVISLTGRSDPDSKQPEILLADVRADALLPVFAQPAAFKADFESESLNKAWKIAEGVNVDSGSKLSGKGALSLSRSLENINQACTVTGPIFAAAPGNWELKFAYSSELHSPDNSYCANVQLACLDQAGQRIERLRVAEVFGKHQRQQFRKLIEFPAGTASARFEVELVKTYGRFLLDDLSASYLAPAPRRDDRIERILFSTAQLGNLLFPADPRTVAITVQARRPLGDSQRALTYVVRDYWGAEQMQPATVTLGPPEQKQDRFVYQTTVDLADVPLEEGRYYELHVQSAAPGQEPDTNYTSLAILPEAATHQYKPEEVPFTARNWDNRIQEYIRLTDRLGVRVCGLWGGWSHEPPYKPQAPGLELVQKLGMGWLTTTPVKLIERGKYDHTDASLRAGVRNLIETYGHVRPLVINLGNEPHGTGEVVLKNVAGYRAVYEAVKKVDPSILVVATSVEPNEEYFKAGYGQWCDAYDFHIYEDSSKVRRTMEEYRALAEKYDVVKPIWSTELGLNSQGQPRHTVAVELYKKLATFFAAGGENVSWFGLLYPDPEGKSFGSSGDSHNIFDCRFNRYCPRLDAVAYYQAVNAIAIKKFVEEKTYADGVHAFLFRDRNDRALQILWTERERQDIKLPLADVNEVQVIRIDGSSRTLQAAGDGVTLSITRDPLLLLYQGGSEMLSPELQRPQAKLTALPETISRHGASTLTVQTRSAMAAGVDLVAPRFWTVTKGVMVSDEDTATVRFTVTPPEQTSIREADFVVTLGRETDGRRGELYYRAVISD